MVSYYTVISGWITTTKQCSPSHSTPTWTVEQSPSTRSRVAPGHPRDREGGQETGTDVGVFPPTLCYMAITPAERQGPVTRRSGRLRGRKRPLSSCFSVSHSSPHSTRRRGAENWNFLFKWWEKIPDSSLLFPVSRRSVPSFPALICTPRGTSPSSVFPQTLQKTTERRLCSTLLKEKY